MPRLGQTLGSSPAPSSTFASNGETARAKLVKLASKAHIFDTGPPDLGADGKDYRANSVHAPFPDKSQRGAPPCGLKARSFQVAASRLVTPRGTS